MMLPAGEQACNPGRLVGPPLVTSLSAGGPGTKAWVRAKGPLQRPANYQSKGALKPRPKLFHAGETPHFHRMYDETGGA